MNYFIYTYIISLLTGRYELNKLASLPMCGFIAQLVEHRIGFAEVMGSNPVEALIFFRFLLSSCLNWKIHCEDPSSLSSFDVIIHFIFPSTKEIKEAKPEQDSSAQTTTDQTQSLTATQAAAQTTASYQPETQNQSPLDSQVAQTTVPATQSAAPVAQPQATATQADTTATQADASATQAAAAFTAPQAAAAPVTPEASVTQTAAYTNSKWFLHTVHIKKRN